MKIELTSIALSACLAMSNGITLGLQAESGNPLQSLIEDATGNFDPISDITDAHDAVQDAINGVIDGACYREAYLPRQEPR